MQKGYQQSCTTTKVINDPLMSLPGPWCSERLLASDPQQFIDSRVQAQGEEDSLLSGNGYPHKGILAILIVKLEAGYP